MRDDAIRALVAKWRAEDTRRADCDVMQTAAERRADELSALLAAPQAPQGDGMEVPGDVALSLELLVRTARHFGNVGFSAAGANEVQHVHHSAHDAVRAALTAAHARGMREGRERIAGLESALMTIAEGKAETRYAVDDMKRANYHIDGVREFAQDALSATLHVAEG